MPVHHRGGGCYQWGGHGKVYCGPGARQKAARQGRAAYAHGYRGAEEAGETPLLLTDQQIRAAIDNKSVGFLLLRAVDFLRLTLEDFDRDLPEFLAESKSIAQYNEWGGTGEIRIAPLLRIDLATGKVRAHEGRHRAAAVYAQDHDGLMWVSIELRDKDGQRIPAGYAARFYGRGYIEDPVTFADVPQRLEAQFNRSHVALREFGRLDPYASAEAVEAGEEAAGQRKRWTAAQVVKTLPTLTMYRGARVGDPRVLSGPSYFISSEVFARTYGPTARFVVTVHKPLVVSNEDWLAYSTHGFQLIDEVAERVRKSGHDSVVNVRTTPAGGELWTMLLLDPADATLMNGGGEDAMITDAERRALRVLYDLSAPTGVDLYASAETAEAAEAAEDRYDRLIVLWKNKPIGVLARQSWAGGEPGYVFSYYDSAPKVMRQPLFEFPKFGQGYSSKQLFSTFAQRVPDPKRPDYAKLMAQWGVQLPPADPMEVLAKSGGRQATDSITLRLAGKHEGFAESFEPSTLADVEASEQPQLRVLPGGARAPYPFALVRDGADDVPVLLGRAGGEDLIGLDVVRGRGLAFEPEDLTALVSVDPAAAYWGVEVTWAREARREEALPLAAEDGRIVEYPADHLPGMIVDRTRGARCTTCRFFEAPRTCGNRYFRASGWPTSDKGPAKPAGSAEIPYDPDAYCTDWYEPAATAREAAEQTSRTEDSCGVPTTPGTHHYEIKDGPYGATLTVIVPESFDRRQHGFSTRAEVSMDSGFWRSYDDWQRDDRNPQLLADVERVLGARAVEGWAGPWALRRNGAVEMVRTVALRRSALRYTAEEEQLTAPSGPAARFAAIPVGAYVAYGAGMRGWVNDKGVNTEGRYLVIGSSLDLANPHGNVVQGDAIARVQEIEPPAAAPAHPPAAVAVDLHAALGWTPVVGMTIRVGELGDYGTIENYGIDARGIDLDSWMQIRVGDRSITLRGLDQLKKLVPDDSGLPLVGSRVTFGDGQYGQVVERATDEQGEYIVVIEERNGNSHRFRRGDYVRVVPPPGAQPPAPSAAPSAPRRPAEERATLDLFARTFLSSVHYGTIEAVHQFVGNRLVPRIVGALRSIGLHEVGDYIGAGSYGVVAGMAGDRSRVVKLTADPTEIRAGTVLLGKQLPHVVRIDDAAFIKNAFVTVPYGEQATVHVGVVIEQRIAGLERYEPGKRLLTQIVRRYKDDHGLHPDDLERLSARKAREALRVGSEGLETALREAGDEQYAGQRYKTARILRDVAEALRELRDVGVYAIDAHGGNVGYDAAADRYMLFDIGTSSTARTVRAARIPATRHRPVRVRPGPVQLGLPGVTEETVRPREIDEADEKGETTRHFPGLDIRKGAPLRARARGFRFQVDPHALSAFPEVRRVLIAHRQQVPSLETIRLSAIFAGLTVHAQTTEAEETFGTLVEQFERLHGAMPPPEEVVRIFDYLRAGRSRMYETVLPWATIVQAALQRGLRDRPLRRHLWVDVPREEQPYGLGLAKLSFALMLLGQDLQCLDTWIVKTMYGRVVDRSKGPELSEAEVKSIIQTWNAHTELSLVRYEQVEDAFVRGNTLYDPKDPLGRSRAHWQSWEMAVGVPAAHRPWLEISRRLLAQRRQPASQVPF